LKEKPGQFICVCTKHRIIDIIITFPLHEQESCVVTSARGDLADVKDKFHEEHPQWYAMRTSRAVTAVLHSILACPFGEYKISRARDESFMTETSILDGEMTTMTTTK
jgi:hypothetical protein